VFAAIARHVIITIITIITTVTEAAGSGARGVVWSIRRGRVGPGSISVCARPFGLAPARRPRVVERLGMTLPMLACEHNELLLLVLLLLLLLLLVLILLILLLLFYSIFFSFINFALLIYVIVLNLINYFIVF
jgi:hypothetical protein